MKELKIIDRDTGELLEDKEFSGGYNIQFATNEDSGRIQHIAKLDNAKFDEKHWIKNLIYRPICNKLVERFEELSHIPPKGILFLEDMEWRPKSGGKHPWIARTMIANKQFKAMTGYEWVIETRNWYTKDMSREQIVALMYHELRHIDTLGDLIPHDIEDWSNMVATLGTDWASVKYNIPDILEDDFEWEELRQAGTQVSVFDNVRELKRANEG